MWAGFGISSKVIIAALVAFFPVLVNVIVGLKTIDQGKLELMRSLGASRWQVFRLVTFPNALPFVFAGLDIAVVFSVLGAIVGEFVGAQQGLGNLIMQFNVTLDIAGVFAVLILLAALGHRPSPGHAGHPAPRDLLGPARRDDQRLAGC